MRVEHLLARQSGVVASDTDVRLPPRLPERRSGSGRSPAARRPAAGRRGAGAAGEATAQKLIPYESGVNPVGEGWSQSQIRYYVFALLFVIFDVEAVFIFPWATQLERYAGFGLVEMGIFVFVLLLGLVYAWRKGVLRWV